MIQLNISDNGCGCQTQSPTTPGAYKVRAFYHGSPDAGHLYGEFKSRESAERCVHILSSRSDVRAVTIEVL